MAEHIIHNKPSLIKRILNVLGMIDLHTKVNCWFCNQDTYILPGTRNTVDHWLCNLCDNLNIRDQNGEIIDPTPFQQRTQYQPPPRGVPTINNSSSNVGTLCNSCQNNQALIYQFMSDYIPEESDPKYEYCCATADEYKAQLLKKYDICDKCRNLIQAVVEGRIKNLRVRNISQNVAVSQKETKLPKRPSRSIYITKGVIWYTIHILTLVFIVYSILYPPYGSVFNPSNYINSYFSFQDYIISFWQEGMGKDELVQLFTRFPITTISSCKQIVNCIFNMNQKYCSWTVSDNIIWILIINVISMKALDWHPYVKNTLYEKVKNWIMYKQFQLALLIMRLFMIIMVTKTQDIRLIWSVMILYITTLIISINIVKISKLPLLKKEIKNSFMKDNSSKQVESEKQQQQQQCQDDVVMTEMDTEMSIPSQPLDPVENIANGINRIRVH